MFIPIAFGSHQVRSANAIDIYMTLHTVFTTFLDFKNGLRLYPNITRKEGCSNTSTVILPLINNK